MGNLHFYDAAYPPAVTPAGQDGVAFYIGGDTPHVWSLAEIEAQHVRFRLPIFVRSNPATADVQADLMSAISRLDAIGAPKGCIVALDSETSVNPNYVAQFFYGMRDAGYTLMDYGSVSTVFGNNIPDGYYWGAHWTNRAGVEPNEVMTQWQALNSYDESDARATLPFWDSSAAPSPAPAPAPVRPETGVQLPLLRLGSREEAVRTVQILCGRRGYFPANSGTPEMPDGDFGPATDAAVRAVQAAAHISVDGRVGQETWPVLIKG